jgi:hypothetical protein
MRIICFIIACLCVVNGMAQQGREKRPIFVSGGNFKNSGWFFSPGIASMTPMPLKEQLTGYDNQAVPDTLYSGEFSRDGGLGLYLEAGRHHFLDIRGPFDHIDYGLSYKMLRGSDEFQGLVRSDTVSYVPFAAHASFNDSYLGAFGNVSNMLQLSNRFWIQNSLGLNVDFRLFGQRGGDQVFGSQWLFPATLPVQAHYKLGFGWKPEPGIFIMPMIETPILNFNAWEGAKATLPYFTGRYRPILFTIRIQWLSRVPERTCEGQPGRQVDLEKQGKHDGNDLFGPDAKKMKRKKKGGLLHFLKRS